MEENNTELEKSESGEGSGGKKKKEKEKTSFAGTVYDIIEMIATTTIVVMLLFAFVVRLNIVDGSSMLNTLHDREYLIVSALSGEPEAGDIVIVHKIDAAPYTEPIVKRVIATEGQVVDIDFLTWTLSVDGEVIEEDYRYVDPSSATLTAEHHMTDYYHFSMTVPEGHIFVMGDNRNHSADSRQREIMTVDTRCVVGKAIARVLPLDTFTIFQNPRAE